MLPFSLVMRDDGRRQAEMHLSRCAVLPGHLSRRICEGFEGEAGGISCRPVFDPLTRFWMQAGMAAKGEVLMRQVRGRASAGRGEAGIGRYASAARDIALLCGLPPCDASTLRLIFRRQ